MFHTPRLAHVPSVDGWTHRLGRDSGGSIDRGPGGHRAPPTRLLALEPSRAGAELATFVAVLPLLELAPRGDGHPVVVLPGFMASDLTTTALRQYLRSLGYRVHPWGLGTNVGPTAEALAGCVDLLERAHDRDGRTVTIIGWSLGGIYARQMARDAPDLVRQVITLGSPFQLAKGSQTHASWLFSRYSHLHVDPSSLPEPQASRGSLPVPTTAIYTRTDGIVRWHTCLTAAGPTAENIEVRGSHCGLGHNVGALWAVADRLAQREGQWAPFRAGPGWRRLFPPAASWRASSPLVGIVAPHHGEGG